MAQYSLMAKQEVERPTLCRDLRLESREESFLGFSLLSLMNSKKAQQWIIQCMCHLWKSTMKMLMIF